MQQVISSLQPEGSDLQRLNRYLVRCHQLQVQPIGTRSGQLEWTSFCSGSFWHQRQHSDHWRIYSCQQNMVAFFAQNQSVCHRLFSNEHNLCQEHWQESYLLSGVFSDTLLGRCLCHRFYTGVSRCFAWLTGRSQYRILNRGFAGALAGDGRRLLANA